MHDYIWNIDYYVYCITYNIQLSRKHYEFALNPRIWG